MYIPPFTITDEIMSLVAEIAEHVGQLTTSGGYVPAPHLRKQNRIKTIHSSLAIENNSLSIQQVTDILEGKRVLGAPNEIQEVRNAIDAYELMLKLNPYKEDDLLKAHRLMMKDLVKENGQYRQGGVGVFDGQQCIHIAPPAERVPLLMTDLMEWIKNTKTHPLISSCVFHYEFEFIHPFTDGNGRIGRMWQTLLLMQWKPIFAWIPVETIVKEHQKDYYTAIAQSDSEGDSTTFISFMLKCLQKAIEEIRKSNQESNQKSNQKVFEIIRRNPLITIREIQQQTGLSESGVKKIIRQLKAEGFIKRIGSTKGGHWECSLLKN
ncbi:MAG: Fic family protein [Bacteroidales bacterium]|nr:Fic family protein [Bacteroidales bacterium]